MSMPLPKDTAGHEIREGATVAYNLSGDVVRGVVVGLSQTVRYGYRDWTIRIRLNYDFSGWPEGHISKVRNSQGVLVLSNA